MSIAHISCFVLDVLGGFLVTVFAIEISVVRGMSQELRGF